jgi:hypothetical protein
MIALKRKRPPGTLLLCMSMACLAASCTSVPVAPPPSHAEQVEQDRATGEKLSARLEKELRFRGDRELQAYLRNLAVQLAQQHPELGAAPIGVFVIEDQAEVWRSFGLPGNRIYLSAGLLREMEFENELVSVIAIQLAHLHRRDLAKRLNEKENSPDLPPSAFFGVLGLFAFPPDAEEIAVQDAVDILYGAGFDVRGVVSLYQRYERNPKHSPYDSGLLPRLIEAARLRGSYHAPLRNPVVRSQAFLAVQQRIRKL